jgi:protein-disulfide isomerase
MQHSGTRCIAVSVFAAALAATVAHASDPPVALVASTPISQQQLATAIGNRLTAIRNQEYGIRRMALDDLINTVLLNTEAKARGIDAATLLEQEVSSRVKAMTVEQAQAVFESAPNRYPGDESRAIESIITAANKQRLARRKIEFIKELRAKYPIQVLLDPPRAQVDTADSPARGPADAPVMIVEFADFECPFCAKSESTLRALDAKYEGRVRWVFRQMPLPMHPKAPKAAEAALCADDQGKFWEFHDRLFDTQKLDAKDLLQHARDTHLAMDAFTQCLESGKHASTVDRDKRDGEALGVGGTPTFFVNGRQIVGAVPPDEFGRLIDEELQQVTTGTNGSKQPERR